MGCQFQLSTFANRRSDRIRCTPGDQSCQALRRRYIHSFQLSCGPLYPQQVRISAHITCLKANKKCHSTACIIPALAIIARSCRPQSGDQPWFAVYPSLRGRAKAYFLYFMEYVWEQGVEGSVLRSRGPVSRTVNPDASLRHQVVFPLAPIPPQQRSFDDHVYDHVSAAAARFRLTMSATVFLLSPISRPISR